MLNVGHQTVDASKAIKFRSHRPVAAVVFSTLAVLLAAVITTGLTDTKEWLQFAVPVPFLALFAHQGLHGNRLSLTPLFVMEGTAARVAGGISGLIAVLSAYFGFFTFMRWFYS